MKNLFKLAALVTLLFFSLPMMAQNNFYKGVFEKETPKSIITANINLYDKTIEGESGEGKCYGTIEIASERGVHGYDIINVNFLDTPNNKSILEVVPWDFPEGVTEVAIKCNPKARTITLDEIGEGLEYKSFDNLVLKKK